MVYFDGGIVNIADNFTIALLILQIIKLMYYIWNVSFNMHLNNLVGVKK